MNNKRILAGILALSLPMVSCPMSTAAADTDTAVSFSCEPVWETGTLSSLPDSDTLFEGYVNSIFSVSPDLFEELGSTSYGYNTLNENEKKAYDIMAAEIKKIAAGERDSSQIDIPFKEITGKDKYTANELGVSAITKDTSAQVTKALLKICDIDFNKLVDALLYDMPYEFYWSSKNFSYTSSFGYSYSSAELSNITPITVMFKTDQNYAKIEGTSFYPYNPDTAKTSAASKAAANAQSIVEKYSSLSDYEKLVKYREEICGLVKYDTYAAQNHTSYYNIRPWQLINVFDNDPNTNVVCEGYAKAFKYLCDMTEFEDSTIDCILVDGDMDGEAHMWNIVTIDGINYLADVTNCDSGSIGADDLLFLKGAYSSDSSKAVMKVGSSTINYVYNTGATEGSTDIPGLYGEEKLIVSTDDYTPPAAPSAPAAPDMLAARVVEGNITLSWNETQDTTEYRIYCSTEYAMPSEHSYTSETNSLTLPELTKGTEYYFWVTAVNDVGESDASNCSSAVPLETAEFISISAKETSVELTWNEVEGIVNYFIYYSEDGILPQTYQCIAREPYANVINLASNTKYTFWVEAHSMNGSAQISEPVTATTGKISVTAEAEPSFTSAKISIDYVPYSKTGYAVDYYYYVDGSDEPVRNTRTDLTETDIVIKDLPPDTLVYYAAAAKINGKYTDFEYSTFRTKTVKEVDIFEALEMDTDELRFFVNSFQTGDDDCFELTKAMYFATEMVIRDDMKQLDE